MNLWKARQISLLGRSQIIKTFGFSQLRFLSNTVIIPKELSKQLKTLAYNFLWNGSERGKVKRKTIVADIKNGGIRFPDLDVILKSQHIVWVKRFFISNLSRSFFGMSLIIDCFCDVDISPCAMLSFSASKRISDMRVQKTT